MSTGEAERWIRKARGSLEGEVGSFPLKNGKRYYYNPQTYGFELLTAMAGIQQADWAERPRPPAPPLLVALCNAKDRPKAMRQMFKYLKTDGQPPCGYCFDTIVKEGKLKPIPTIAGVAAQDPSPEGVDERSISRSPETDDFEQALKDYQRRWNKPPVEDE